MATVTGLTAERMEAIEAQSIVGGTIVGDNLILTRFDDATIDAGNVRGPTGSPGITGGEMAAEMEAAFLLNAPVCSIIETLESTAPNELWLTMVGQTVIDGETLYPIFWSKIPAAMKSGSNIIMPNTKGRVSVGLDPADVDFNVIGKTGGAKTHVLTAAEMPSHTHTGPSHTHTGPLHTHTGPSHTHTLTGTSDTHTGHAHAPIIGGVEFVAVSATIQNTEVAHTGGTGRWISAGGGTTTYPFTAPAGAHNHAVSGTTAPSGTADTGSSGTAATGPSGTAATGPAGSGSAHNNVPPYITFLKIIKVA